MTERISRRKFVQGSLIATAGGTLAVNAGIGQAFAQNQDNKPTAPKVDPGSKNTLPKGKIGNLEMSRMILGGNLMMHGMHSHGMPALQHFPDHYNTTEKRLETMALAESYGIDTIGLHSRPGAVDLIKKYKKEWGGKIKTIMNPIPSSYLELQVWLDLAKQLVDDGFDAICIFGEHAEVLLKAGRMGNIIKMVEYVKDLGVPAGVGAHDLNVIRECEKNKVDPDFYVKTLHHHKYPTAPRPEQIKGATNEVSPSYWCSDPEGTIEFMKTVEKPWIAFKVMACGAIPPKDAFPYAINNGADFVWAGMFDFDVADDVQIIKEAVASAKRVRPWRS